MSKKILVLAPYMKILCSELDWYGHQY